MPRNPIVKNKPPILRSNNVYQVLKKYKLANDKLNFLLISNKDDLIKLFEPYLNRPIAKVAAIFEMDKTCLKRICSELGLEFDRKNNSSDNNESNNSNNNDSNDDNNNNNYSDNNSDNDNNNSNVNNNYNVSHKKNILISPISRKQCARKSVGTVCPV